MGYPEKTKAELTSRICGPDELCNDRYWLITGTPGESVTIQLQIIDAHITMTVESLSGGKFTGHSVDGTERHVYHIAGTFNGWVSDKMIADAMTPGIFKYNGTMGPMCEEYFSISIEGQTPLKLFPEAPYCTPGEYIVKGPDQADDDKCWQIKCLRPGANFEIIVNRNAADKRKVVDINWLTDPADEDSMKAAVYNYLSMPQTALMG